VQIFYSLTELERALAEDAKRRVGYTAEGEALITAKAARTLAEGEDDASVPCIIIEVALPEAVADEVLVPSSKVEEVKGGTVRGRASKKAGTRSAKK
jgi:hypothetical protein